jgi:hypothetical protein
MLATAMVAGAETLVKAVWRGGRGQRWSGRLGALRWGGVVDIYYGFFLRKIIP